jgi:hypothetical protein
MFEQTYIYLKASFNWLTNEQQRRPTRWQEDTINNLISASMRADTWGHLTVKDCANWYSNFAVLELLILEMKTITTPPRNTENSSPVDMA